MRKVGSFLNNFSPKMTHTSCSLDGGITESILVSLLVLCVSPGTGIGHGGVTCLEEERREEGGREERDEESATRTQTAQGG